MSWPSRCYTTLKLEHNVGWPSWFTQRRGPAEAPKTGEFITLLVAVTILTRLGLSVGIGKDSTKRITKIDPIAFVLR